MARIQIKRGDDYEPEDAEPNYPIDRLLKMNERFCAAVGDKQRRKFGKRSLMWLSTALAGAS